MQISNYNNFESSPIEFWAFSKFISWLIGTLASTESFTSHDQTNG